MEERRGERRREERERKERKGSWRGEMEEWRWVSFRGSKPANEECSSTKRRMREVLLQKDDRISFLPEHSTSTRKLNPPKIGIQNEVDLLIQNTVKLPIRPAHETGRVEVLGAA